MALRTPYPLDTQLYPFAWLRYALEVGAPVQNGVTDATAMRVTAAAGGGMRVDIAAGSALVKGLTGSPVTGLSHGLYVVVNDANQANAATLTAAHATLPRVDQVVVRVRDSTDLASAADDAIFEVVPGVATSGATLDNRLGAAALGNDRLRLADVLVPAAASSVLAGNVRDRRLFSRGFVSRATYGGGSIALSSTSVLFNAALQRRVEVHTGALVHVRFSCRAVTAGTSAIASVVPYVDGAEAAASQGRAYSAVPPGMAAANANIDNTLALFAGSHLVGAGGGYVNSGSATLTATSGEPGWLTLVEDVRPIADNN